MADVEVLRDGELMVSQLSGESDAGIDFIDAYMPADVEIVVVDSGRIILPEANVESFISACRKQGLTVSAAE